MRLPSDVLDRVRGALVIAALTSCSQQTKTAPPPASAVTATAEPPAPAPAPVDPVRYTSAEENERLARIDAEDAASAEARRARIGKLAARRDDQELHFGIGNGPGLTGIQPGDISRFGCNACGRG